MQSNDQFYKSFGQFIKEGREARYLTQARAASLVGISQCYWSQIEQGNRRVRLALTLDICEKLRLDLGGFCESLHQE